MPAVGRIVELSFGFPTIVFTTLLLFSLGYWILSMLLGAGGDGLDFDLDGDIDLDLDLDVDNNVSQGLGGLMRTFHLHHIPLSLTFTLLSLFGWFFSLLATSLVTETSSTSIIVGVGVLIGSLLLSGFLTGRLGQLLAPAFRSASATTRSDLIGKICVIRTGSVTGTFGQAEVLDSDGGTHLIQVRSHEQNDLGQGSKALLVSVDEDGIFGLSPDVEGLA